MRSVAILVCPSAGDGRAMIRARSEILDFFFFCFSTKGNMYECKIVSGFENAHTIPCFIRQRFLPSSGWYMRSFVAVYAVH